MLFCPSINGARSYSGSLVHMSDQMMKAAELNPKTAGRDAPEKLRMFKHLIQGGVIPVYAIKCDSPLGRFLGEVTTGRGGKITVRRGIGETKRVRLSFWEGDSPGCLEEAIFK